MCQPCALRLRRELELHPHGRLLAVGVFGNLATMLWLYAQNLGRLGFVKPAWAMRVGAVVSAVVVPFALTLPKRSLVVIVVNGALTWGLLRPWEQRFEAHRKQGGATAPFWQVVVTWLAFAVVMILSLWAFVPVGPSR